MHTGLDSHEPGEITSLFQSGDPRALNQAIQLLYRDLKLMAGRYLKGRVHQTMQPTALVHEAYMVLAEANHLVFQNREHFFNCAALIMRQALARYAAKAKSLKRGAAVKPITFEDVLFAENVTWDPDILLTLDRALNKLKNQDERKCRMVVLRLYLGMKEAEIATVLDVTARTVRRDWAFVKTWLAREFVRSGDGR